MDQTTDRTGNTNRSLEKSLRVLILLGEAGRDLGITELCKDTGFPPGTMSRIISTFTKMGFVVQDAVTKKYRLGPMITRLASPASQLAALKQAAQPILYELRNRTAETSHLYVRRGTYREHVDFVESTHDLRTGGKVGELVPIHAGAASRVLWAFDSDAGLLSSLDSWAICQVTRDTIVDKEKLFKEAKKIQKLGYAVSLGERNPSIGAIAAPVFGPDRTVVAAVSVSMPSVRFTPEHIESLVPEVLWAAEALHEVLSSTRNGETASKEQ